MRDVVTLQRRLSLAGRKPRLIPVIMHTKWQLQQKDFAESIIVNV